MWWKKTKVEVDPRAEIKETLQKVCDQAKLDRDMIVTSFTDTVSLVCFVNADIPPDRKAIHISETIAEYFFFAGQKSYCQNWYERHKTTGKKDKIICFNVPNEDMQVLFKDHQRVLRSTGKSPFHTTSAITYGGKVYPMAFSLGS